MKSPACWIIGAGPAGAATAIVLRRLGWPVTLIDRRARVEQKVCGECLSPPSRALLAGLGALERIPASQIVDLVGGITLVSPCGEHCTLDFGAERAFTIPRPVLDAALLDTAREAGARVEPGRTVTALERGANGSRELRTREGDRWTLAPGDLLIGADGRHSWVAREAGLAARGGRPHWLRHAAVFGHFALPEGERLPGVEMHVAPWGYVGINPLPDSTLNVIAVLEPALLRQKLASTGSRGHLMELLLRLSRGEEAPPALRARLARAEPLGHDCLSVGPMAWVPARVTDRDTALVGDSAGFVDPFTGEGLYHALASATELGRKLESGTSLEAALGAYGSWHREVFGPEERFCLLLQRLLPYPRAADYVIGRLARKPELARTLAEAVADRLPVRHVLAPGFLARLLWPAGGAALREGKEVRR